jgi:trk system potassium uptake protein TrkH
MSSRKLADFSPGRTILYSMFIAIIIGTSLLALPFARTRPIPLIDLFFTATSATCVTGAFTIPLSSFTLLGQVIILILIQIGGLGLVTMSLFLLSLFINFGMATQLMAGQILEFESWPRIKNLLFFIILATFGSELIGALLFFSVFRHDFALPQALLLSAFHAVSSFCNAGIELLPGHLEKYSSNYTVLITSILLMFFGGLGFITWRELIKYVRAKFQKKRYLFSLHSKIILYTSLALLMVSGIIFWILEHDHALKNFNAPLTIINAIFYAVSMKSAGLLLLPAYAFQLATMFMIMIFGLIGSSPGSTGSGIKITTFAIVLATVRATLNGDISTNIKGRRIPTELVYKAFAIVMFSIGWIVLTTFCLLITEPNPVFSNILFETISAFSTLGITTDTTTHLSSLGKLFIIASMIIGRVGSLTLILALKVQRHGELEGIKYPEERIMLG